MIAALITIAQGLGGAFGFITLLYLTAWQVTRHDHDYDEPDALDQAKDRFALSGTRADYNAMLDIVTAPSALRWYNSATDDSDEAVTARIAEAFKKATFTQGARVVDAATQAQWADMAEATERRAVGASVAVENCNCTICNNARRNGPMTDEQYQAWILARSTGARIAEREFPSNAYSYRDYLGDSVNGYRRG